MAIGRSLSGAGAANPAAPRHAPATPVLAGDVAANADYFVVRDGVRFAGTHLLIDLWDAHRLDDTDHVEQALRDAAAACGATVLHVHLHAFEPSGGVSGVAVLAESHISIHTWPERAYAALDIFMCGRCNPHDALPVLRAAFRPGSVQLNESKRGLLP